MNLGQLACEFDGRACGFGGACGSDLDGSAGGRRVPVGDGEGEPVGEVEWFPARGLRLPVHHGGFLAARAWRAAAAAACTVSADAGRWPGSGLSTSLTGRDDGFLDACDGPPVAPPVAELKPVPLL